LQKARVLSHGDFHMYLQELEIIPEKLKTLENEKQKKLL
jgi:hypothetical protein